ncbi:hypothetical protein RhiTH_009608 [Rhizoctonia solani]
MTRHFKQHHHDKSNQQEKWTRQCSMQSLKEKPGNNQRYFEVSSELLPPNPSQPYITSSANGEQLIRALKQAHYPAAEPLPNGSSLKDTMPLLFFTGFASHVSNFKTLDLLELVSYPTPGTSFHRASKEAFKPLTKGPGKEYARSMARWFVFVLRLYQMQVCQNQTWYQMTFTDEQLRSCTLAMEFVDEQDDAHEFQYLMNRMSHAFWVAYNEETFAHLEKDNFDDPTTRFAALICLRPDDAETPFGHICDAVGLATKYASTSAHAPNVSWSGDDSLSVEGYTVYWPKLVDALHDLLASTENLLLTGVFKSLDPVGDLGLELTPETTIKDVLSETGNRYSCFTNPANGYGHLEGRLASTFFTKLSGYLTKGVHKNAEGKEVITWDLKEAERWLDIYDECVQRLCLLTTMLGGQPARGTKITSMKLVNSAHRVRGVYVLRPGVLVFVGMYGKTTSNTTLDRLVAHAVPWKLGRLFLYLNILAQPLAGVLVEHLHGPAARAIQETSAWPVRGVEMTLDGLSNLIRRFFVNNTGANFGIRALRHMMCAAQRRKAPQLFISTEKLLASADVIAGHVTDTASHHYAVDAAELH